MPLGPKKEGCAMKTKSRPPIHPGEILREEFMVPLGLTAYAVAKACQVPRTRIERIAREEVAITADTAIRLGRYFGTTPQFWMNLQADYDLRTARAALGEKVQTIKQREPEAA
jgi:antitoxin HigA-1